MNLHGNLELEQPASNWTEKCSHIIPMAQITRIRKVSVDNALTWAITHPQACSCMWHLQLWCLREQRDGSQGRQSTGWKTEVERGRNVWGWGQLWALVSLEVGVLSKSFHPYFTWMGCKDSCSLLLLFVCLFGCSESLLLGQLFSSCDKQELLSRSSPQASDYGGFSCCGAWALGHAGSVVQVFGLSCPVACGIFPDRGWNSSPLHWQADS